MKLSLGFSPCPNDCFMFDAIVNRRIDLEGLEFAVHLADVEALNDAAFAGQARRHEAELPRLRATASIDYVLLDAGSALGRNCGPLLISKRADLDGRSGGGGLRIAIPGQVHDGEFPARSRVSRRARQDRAAVLRDRGGACSTGDFDAGLIIHENRFTYEAKGLKKIVDLGEFWESETGAPIPLGGIVISRLAAGRRQAAR